MIFKCKDEILFRMNFNMDKGCWTYGVVSHETEYDVVLSGDIRLSKNVHEFLPYYENQQLVGTNTDIDKGVELNKGDIVYFFDTLQDFRNLNIYFKKYEEIVPDTQSMFDSEFYKWKYCIPYNQFDMDDMEKTKSNILKVSNGRLVKAFVDGELIIRDKH